MESDHHIIIVWLEQEDHRYIQKKAQRKRAKTKKIYIDLQRIVLDNWEDFAQKTDALITSQELK